MESPIKKFLLYQLLATSVVGVSFVTWYLHVQFGGVEWNNALLNASINIASSMIAVLISFLLILHGKQERDRKLYLLSIGLLGMSLLGGFSANITDEGISTYVKCIGSVFGGLCFILAQIFRLGKLSLNKWLPILVAISCVIFTASTLLFPDMVPSITDNKGSPTFFTQVLSITTSLLFISASFLFLVDFHLTSKISFYLKACIAFLFGLSSIALMLSSSWNTVWWFSNLLQTAAYLLTIALAYLWYKNTLLDSRVTKLQEEQKIDSLSGLLFKSQELSQLLLNYVSEAIISVDLSGTIVDWNIKAEEILGWLKAEALGKKMVNLIVIPINRQSFEESFNKNFNEKLHNGKPDLVPIGKEFESILLHKKGYEIPAKVIIRSIKLGNFTTFNFFIRSNSSVIETKKELTLEGKEG